MDTVEPSQHWANSISYICERFYNLSGKSLDKDIQATIRRCLEIGVDADAISLKLTSLFKERPDMALKPDFVAGMLEGMYHSQQGDYEEMSMVLFKIKHILTGKYGVAEGE